MFRHNLLLVYRNFKRFKSVFFINLMGLSTGLACVLLIYLWVNDELVVDKFNTHDANLYHIWQNLNEAGTLNTGPGTPGLLGKELVEEMPEIELMATTVPPEAFEEHAILSLNDKRVKVKTQFASKDFFQVFSYPLVRGDKSQALADIKNIVISEELAKNFFNSAENAQGKTITWSSGDKNELYTISGVFKIPGNATAKFDILLNYDVYLKDRPWLSTWTSSDPYCYVVLRDGTSPEAFSKKIKNFVKGKDAHSNATLFIQRFSDHYLHGRFENGKSTGGRIEYVTLFSIIAIFILIIASINYMNLSTAKASQRVKEVGIKKAIGAKRKTLIVQYVGESLLMSVLSMILAVLMVDLFLPQFNIITGKHLHLEFTPTVIISCITATVITGLLAGSYPAFYLSGFNPAATLKGKLSIGAGEVIARKGLVIFQFAISIVLIVSAVVVYQQIRFVQSKNLGYKRDNVVYFDTEKVSDAYMAELKAIPGVINAGRFYHDLTGQHGGTYALDWEGKKPDELIDFGNLEMGYDLIETLNIQMAEGKPFSREFGSVDQIIFNKAAIKAMGLKDPVGKTINIWGMKREIVGVTEDFNFESLYEEVKPCFLFLVPMVDNTSAKIVVKIEGGKEQDIIPHLQKFYEARNPGLPFDYKFLDQDYQRLYSAEQRVADLSRYFAGIAILISCLGLYGLAAFNAERRLKEIGIRKVLGSTVVGVVLLLTKDFTKMVMIAIVIALPLSYLIAENWLENFQFRTHIEIQYLVFTGFFALVIAWVTVGIQTVRAARVNPAKCLKDE